MKNALAIASAYIITFSFVPAKTRTWPLLLMAWAHNTGSHSAACIGFGKLEVATLDAREEVAEEGAAGLAVAAARGTAPTAVEEDAEDDGVAV